jgi:hypothetical protein
MNNPLRRGGSGVYKRQELVGNGILTAYRQGLTSLFNVSYIFMDRVHI